MAPATTIIEIAAELRRASGQTANVYIEDAAGRRAAAQLAHERRSAADRGQYCEAAGLAAMAAVLKERPWSRVYW
jgi:hypothetical protein